MLVSFKSDKYNACHVKKKGVGFFFPRVVSILWKLFSVNFD